MSQDYCTNCGRDLNKQEIEYWSENVEDEAMCDGCLVFIAETMYD